MPSHLEHSIWSSYSGDWSWDSPSGSQRVTGGTPPEYLAPTTAPTGFRPRPMTSFTAFKGRFNLFLPQGVGCADRPVRDQPVNVIQNPTGTGIPIDLELAFYPPRTPVLSSPWNFNYVDVPRWEFNALEREWHRVTRELTDRLLDGPRISPDWCASNTSSGMTIHPSAV